MLRKLTFIAALVAVLATAALGTLLAEEDDTDGGTVPYTLWLPTVNRTVCILGVDSVGYIPSLVSPHHPSFPMIQLFPDENFDNVPLQERPRGQFQLSSNETFDPGQYLYGSRWWSESEVLGQCANGLCGNILTTICKPGLYVRARMICVDDSLGQWSQPFLVMGETCQ